MHPDLLDLAVPQTRQPEVITRQLIDRGLEALAEREREREREARDAALRERRRYALD